MRRTGDTLLAAATTVMELSWLYAWSAFTLHLFDTRAYGLTEAACVFGLSWFTTKLGLGRAWRRIELIAAQLGCLLALGLFVAHALWYSELSVWNAEWLRDLFSRQHTPRSWLVLCAFLVWTAVLWISGQLHARRARTYEVVCARFDRGLIGLFALLFIKLLLRNQPDARLIEHTSEAFVVPFFVSGLGAIALARNRSQVRKGFIRGYRGIGLILGFGVAVSAAGAGLFLVALPWLTAASDAGSSGLYTAARPVAHAAADAVLYLLGQRPDRQIELRRKPPQTKVLRAALPERPQLEPAPLANESLFVGLLVGAVVLVGLAYGWRWLLSRHAQDPPGESVFDALRRLLERWLAALRRFIGRHLATQPYEEPLRLYRALLLWGRRSGVSCRPSETAREYGLRLNHALPGVDVEIDMILTVFNTHLYGQAQGDDSQLERARRALRKLQSPRLWPRRARLWVKGV